MINNEAAKGIIENVSVELINTAKKNKNDIILAFSPLEIKELLNELLTNKQPSMCDFSDITDEEIENIVEELNSIPEEYLTFVDTFTMNQDSSCEYCSNNPKNGGSGICNCVAGQMKIT